MILCVALLCLPGLASPAESPTEAPPDIELFASPRCPHCHAATRFLQQLQRELPGLTVAIRDVDHDPAALDRLRELSGRFGYRGVAVPTFFLRGELIVGFEGPGTTGARIRALVDTREAREDACRPGRIDPCPQEGGQMRAPEDHVETRLFGHLDAQELGLPLFTLALGLLDGFNPCAMWVLLFLLSILVNLRDRARMALIAGTFVLTSGLVYFAFMAAWLNIFLVIGVSRAIQLVLGGVAVLIGLFNVKDFAAPGAGASLSIRESAKPGIYARVRAIMRAEHLGGALVGVALLAALVNTVELVCTAGFPAVFTHILVARDLPWWSYYGYLALYNLAYILDDAVMVTVAIVTLGHRKLQEQQGRWLKLLSGLVMLALGSVLLVNPSWLAT